MIHELDPLTSVELLELPKSDPLADAELDSTEINACGGGGGALTVSVRGTVCTAVDSLSVEAAAAD